MSSDDAILHVPLHRRARAGMRHRHNWHQLLRFGLVGAGGYVVNLVVFTLAAHPGGIPYQPAAVVAFLAGVLNNFVWNRIWTFDARGGHAAVQSARFFAVSLAAFVISLVILTALVEGAGLPKVVAQAIAVVAATPFNFLGNRLWSFAD